LGLIAASCQKVIQVDLNSANPAIVIEGGITDTTNGAIVRITKTADYFNGTSLPEVSGATVQITDKEGNTTNLIETLLPINGTPAKVYLAQNITPKHGEIYTLSVLAEGKSYTAQSSMLTPVKIDSIKFLKGLRPRQGGAIPPMVAHCYFKDPKGIANYYRLRIHLLNRQTTKQIEGYNLREDTFFDGNENDFSFDNMDLQSGDKIEVQLISIDNMVYDYFKTLANIVSGGGGASSSSPANPNSNLSNNALGYFAAESISSMKATVP
jgi:hypothetical protein